VPAGRAEPAAGPRSIRSDRILHEALTVGPDPLHLALVFNLSQQPQVGVGVEGAGGQQGPGLIDDQRQVPDRIHPVRVPVGELGGETAQQRDRLGPG
jgi:hypothetical protein